MTTVSITFVICLNEKERKMSKKSIRETLKENDSNEYNVKAEDIPFETNTKYVLYLERPVKCLQIEYEIFPKVFYNIEILFWGSVAKITTKEATKIIASITKMNNRWIAFTIEHKIMLDIDELMALKLHTILFTMRIVSVPMYPDFFTFYFPNEDIDYQCIFSEAFEYIPNNDYDETEENVKFIYREIMYFAYKGEILNILKLPDVNCRKKILNMVNSFAAKKEYECFNTYMNETEKNNKKPSISVAQKSKKSVSSSKSLSRKRLSSLVEMHTIQLNVPGEVFFTDPNFTAFHFPKTNRDVKCAYVIIQVKRLMNFHQKSVLNPVVVRLNKLINVPTQRLTELRYEHLYLTYNLCNFICSTVPKPINDVIHFNNHQIYFLEDKIVKFTQQVQKDYLIVKVYGIRKHVINKETQMFGSNPEDKFFSVPLRNKEDVEKYLEKPKDNTVENDLIAVACFKLNLLLSIFRSFEQTEYCLHPSRCPISLTKDNDESNMDTFTINTINTDFVQKTVYPLSEDIIMDNSFSLVIQMELYKSINKILDRIIEKEILLNRIILISGHGDFVKYILSNVFKHNSCWIYKDDIIPPNYLPYAESNTDINNTNIITGFVIDNSDICIMFLEGNSKWIKHILWKQIKHEHFSCVKILYNSDHVYKERVYTCLLPYGGIYNITLHSSLKALLDCSRVFSPGYMPEPCRRAFEKIDMILKSKYSNDITINMLPTKKELFSLDIEWGVPVYWPITEKQEQQEQQK